jgi:hypothetical protein
MACPNIRDGKIRALRPMGQHTEQVESFRVLGVKSSRVAFTTQRRPIQAMRGNWLEFRSAIEELSIMQPETLACVYLLPANYC